MFKEAAFLHLKCLAVASTHPGMLPPGPMEVWNIRLNEMGGVRSFPVLGDFTLYCMNRSASSCCV